MASTTRGYHAAEVAWKKEGNGTLFRKERLEATCRRWYFNGRALRIALHTHNAAFTHIHSQHSVPQRAFPVIQSLPTQ